ncbi:MAG: lipoate--protein ligase [Bacteroides sp.]|nr:lipoate--protein ligase [Bacteroides sp.]
MRYLRNDSTDPYFNMAFDEYCLEHQLTDKPLFYLWQNSPSVIIGANQQLHTETDLSYLQANGILPVRRVSGGGAVYHDEGNLNYSIVGCSNDLEEHYPEYAGLMAQALQRLGVPATLSGRNDILVEGRKVSGFAKRVVKGRLMVHGTLMYDVNLERLAHALTPSADKLSSKGIASVRSRVCNLKAYLPHLTDITLLRNALERILSNDYADKEFVLSEEDLRHIRHTGEEKFASWEWIYGRSPQATLSQTARLACGSVTVRFNIRQGLIADCRFEGDFLGGLPIEEVERRLNGLPYDRASLEKVLEELPIGKYLDGVKPTDLLKIII